MSSGRNKFAFFVLNELNSLSDKWVTHTHKIILIKIGGAQDSN